MNTTDTQSPTCLGTPDCRHHRVLVSVKFSFRIGRHVRRNYSQKRILTFDQKYKNGGGELKIGMNGGVLWGRPRPGRGGSDIYGWMDVIAFVSAAEDKQRNW